MIIQKEIRNLIKELAELHGLSFEAAREAIYSQFKYTRGQIESAVKGEDDTFKNIRLRFLGTFHVSKKKLEFFRKKYEEENDE